MNKHKLNKSQLMKITGGFGVIDIEYALLSSFWKHRKEYWEGYKSSPFH